MLGQEVDVGAVQQLLQLLPRKYGDLLLALVGLELKALSGNADLPGGVALLLFRPFFGLGLAFTLVASGQIKEVAGEVAENAWKPRPLEGGYRASIGAAGSDDLPGDDELRFFPKHHRPWMNHNAAGG